jgi:hypothetical protein
MLPTTNRNKSFAAGLIAVALIGASLSLRKSPVGVVGSTSISQREVEYRDSVVRIYFPNEKRKLGFFQLYKSAINLEILRNNGIEFLREQVLTEEKRISKNSRAPERLSAIRDIFGDDFESYLKVFVLPNLADRYIYSEFFLTNSHVQAKSLATAHKLISQLRATGGDGMSALARMNGYKFDILDLSSKGGPRWHAQKDWNFESQKYAPTVKVSELPRPQSGNVANQWYEKVVAHLSAGNVYPEPISYDDFWLIVRSGVKRTGESNQLEIIFVPKLNYQTWYEQEKSKLAMQADESIFKEELKP